MAITQNHVINIQPGVSAPLVIHCSQGDTGTQINLTVVNGDEEFDCSSYACSVHGVRSDGGNWGPVTCNVSGSTVSFSLTSDMTAVAGSCLAEVSIGTVGTANFAILVENATFSLGVTYTEDTSVYQSILNYINVAIDQMNTKANDLQNQYAVTNAKLDTAISAATQDSEVQDIRVKADGTSAATAGNAVREQINGLKNELIDDRVLNDIVSETIGISTGLGAGPVASTRRWFMPEIIPANSIIEEINYFCGSATSGSIDIELWKKNGNVLDRVFIKTQTPTASTWNKLVASFFTDSPLMLSFKASNSSIRSDSTATGKKTYASADLTGTKISFSSLEPFDKLQLCANARYISKDQGDRIVVDANGNGDFSSFSQALITTFANRPNTTIIVNPGTYNIYQEMIDIYGSDYWDTITTSQADQKRNLFGLPFGNGMKIQGCDGAIVVMDNVSSNVNVKTQFSILHGEDDPNNKYQGAEIKNIVFKCKNIRYAVHLDFGAALNRGEYVIESCKMTLDNSENDQRTNAYVLGMGGGAYTTYKFCNNYLHPIFPSNTRDRAGIYYHNSSYANAKNCCDIINNYISNGGTIRIDEHGESQNECLVMITGNSIGGSLMVNDDSDNLEVVAWNNTVRN